MWQGDRSPTSDLRNYKCQIFYTFKTDEMDLHPGKHNVVYNVSTSQIRRNLNHTICYIIFFYP